MHDLKYDINDLLDYAPMLAKQVSGILPVNSLYEDKYQRIEGIDKLLVKDFEDIISKTIERARSRHPQIDIESILMEIPDIDKQMLCIAYLRKEKINLIELENNLKLLFCKWVVIIRLFTMFRAHCISISHFFWRQNCHFYKF